MSDITSSLSSTMTDFVRRLVSGDKARFKDEKLDLELGEPHTNLKHHQILSVEFISKISYTSQTG